MCIYYYCTIKVVIFVIIHFTNWQWVINNLVLLDPIKNIWLFNNWVVIIVYQNADLAWNYYYSILFGTL